MIVARLKGLCTDSRSGLCSVSDNQNSGRHCRRDNYNIKKVPIPFILQVASLKQASAGNQQENDALKVALSSAAQMMQGKLKAAQDALYLKSLECAELEGDVSHLKQKLHLLQSCLNTANLKSSDLSARFIAQEHQVRLMGLASKKDANHV